MQSFWDSNIGNLHIKQLVDVFELTPDILFWIKDKESRIVHANSAYIEHVGCSSKHHVYGKTDAAFVPPHLASQYMLDDIKILRGELVTSRLEMNVTTDGEFAWFSTSKRPLKDNAGHIIGTYGITRHFQKSSQALATFDSIKVPIDFIRQNYHSPISLTQLAELAHLSVSALERRFKKHLSKTPTQLINEVRLERARLLVMETNTRIAEIAFKTGFSDHSYFTKQFKRFFGQQPSSMREEVVLANRHKL